MVIYPTEAKFVFIANPYYCSQVYTLVIYPTEAKFVFIANPYCFQSSTGMTEAGFKCTRRTIPG